MNQELETLGIRSKIEYASDMKVMRIFFILVLTTASIIFISTKILSKISLNSQNTPHYLNESTVSTELIDPRITNPIQAKEKGLLWIQNSSSEGYALKIFQSPIYFSKFYPGYSSELLKNSEFKRDYFSRSFETDIHLNTISENFGKEFTLVLPWLGCLDIYKQAGADVIIIGTSETFRSIVIDDLASHFKSLNNFKDRDPKVLMCAGSALQIDSARELIERLLNIRPNEKPILIYGQSYSVAFTKGSKNISYLKEKKQELFSYDLNSARARTTLFTFFEDYHHISFADLFPKWTWQNIFPFSYGAWLTEAGRNELPDLADIKSDPELKYRFIKKDLLNNPSKLNEDIELRMKPYYKVFNDFADNRDCNSEELMYKLKQLFERATKLSNNIYVFIPPPTPLVFEAIPKCLQENLVKDLNILSNEHHFKLKTADWNEYQLGYQDFARPTNHQDIYRIDVQHTNYDGAMKVTSALANWIKKDIAK